MLRFITMSLLMLSTAGMSAPAFAHRYHFDPAICSQLGINPGASRPLGQFSANTTGCRTRMSNGYPIPDPKCTPGAINPTVTSEVLADPSFRTKCIRNHVTTEHEKFVTYSWYGIHHPRHNHGRTQVCELDHLVPLELGGADTLDNIWPQCGPSDTTLWKRYFKRKDLVENYLAKMVREGKMRLVDAQQGIAQDWTQYLPAAKRECQSVRCR